MDPGWKVGIVGRTGAGKSSIVQALLRLRELSEGAITIDGVDTSEIELATLRGAVSLIPQAPFLFESSLRENLDPFHEYTDDQVWEALANVQLREYVSNFQSGLL